MATYYHGNSEIQGGGGNGGDGLQTLILMNPGYLGYSENQQPHQHEGSNFVFLNSNNHGNSLSMPHAPPNNPTHQLVGVPLTATGSSSTAQENQDGMSTLHGYSLYSPSNVDFTAREISRSQQGGLSLSLSNRQPGYDLRGSGVVLSSKYLKATQEILDEVVSVGKVEKSEKFKGVNGQNKNNNGELSMGEDGNHENGENGREGNVKRCAELSTSEKQEIQMKKSKLVNMLDEVEQRYRQYHHQMQMVIFWFEQAAGIGSAKTYTSLALKTISKQFRCLKDAILGQIKAASKSLGEEDDFCRKTEGSRLKFVDNHLTQQRALQQLGMVQHNTWRPQRGLPERAVSVLRAWLFEHFLHPYPKDSDKIILAKQTGLTRSQVSNWFINARVRLWKPMVEEMYAEEMNGQEKNNASSEDNNKTNKSENDDSTSKATASHDTPSPSFVSKETEMETLSHGISKKLRPPPSINMDSESNNENDDQMAMKFDNEKQGRGGFSFMGGPTNLMGGFGSYSMGELGRFGTDQFPVPYSGNGVSLTLGLPHCENLSMLGNHQSFLQNHQGMQVGRGVEMEENDFGNINAPPTSTHPTNVYDNLDIQNRKRFSAQLLPDFVT